MKDLLAERLLAKVLGWTSEQVAVERPIVQALAAYKYDEYQQFSAGSRFIESLALWLDQFQSAHERRDAYEFVKTKLVFCSSAELRHLVEMAYPDHIRPILLDAAGGSDRRFRPSSTASTDEFRIRQRQCLFLGLSDGARIDSFRRANPALNHEQIWQTHELSQPRVDKLLSKLSEHLEDILGRPPEAHERRFRTLVLLDDFSASGTSYFSLPADAPTGGKIFSFFDDVCGEKPAARLIDPNDVEVITVLYMATEQAINHLQKASQATWGARGIQFRIEVVQPLPNEMKLALGQGAPINSLIEHPNYYDPALMDSHLSKGGTSDVRFGYADCGLPLVLHHNTPNNSISLLFAYETLKFRGLFPRIQRHREMS
ncbi:MAG: hypothetical protein WC815_17590 [Vicinamibacterales bacterium]